MIDQHLLNDEREGRGFPFLAQTQLSEAIPSHNFKPLSPAPTSPPTGAMSPTAQGSSQKDNAERMNVLASGGYAPPKEVRGSGRRGTWKLQR